MVMVYQVVFTLIDAYLVGTMWVVCKPITGMSGEYLAPRLMGLEMKKEVSAVH